MKVYGSLGFCFVFVFGHSLASVKFSWTGSSPRTADRTSLPQKHKYSDLDFEEEEKKDDGGRKNSPRRRS
jgi:hypothetical protein